MRKVEHIDFKRNELIVLLLSIFMMSFTVLTLEISLTRMFSVMFAYHYAFLAVAVAFAGLGIGGILAQLVFSETSKKEMFMGLAITYSIFALLTSFFTFIIASMSLPNFAAASILFFFSFLPAGMFLATAYKVFALYSNVLYAADIAGASVGSIGAATFLNGFSPILTVLAVCTVVSATSFLLAFFSKKKTVYGMFVVVLLLTASVQSLAIYSSKDVPMGSDQEKEIYEILKNPTLGARIAESRWSAFGRTDLIEYQSDPHSKLIFIDGGAGTQMYHFNGNFSDLNNEVSSLRFTTASYPFYFTNKENALVIGPGGGVDVLITLMFNFSHIHAVEINQDTVNIVKDYFDYNGGIYTNYSNVHVHVDEGRSFLKRTPMKYDAIMLNIPITKTVQGTSGYSLSENYLFTIDSIKDYLSSLKDDGYLVVIAHERFEVYKLVATALKTLESEGRNTVEGMHQLVITESMGHPPYPAVILKKAIFASNEVDKMIERSIELGLHPVYFPHANSTVNQYSDQLLVALGDGKIDLNTFYTEASKDGVDLEPPTDDRPFFYKIELGLPSTLSQLLSGSIILAVIIILVYLFTWGRRLSLAFKKEKHLLAEKFSAFMPYYFASLGLGFMLIEVALIQKFILFLGPPTLAISVVLFSLLLSMGVGSFFSKKSEEPTILALKVSLIIAVIIISYVLILSSIFSVFLSLDLTLRLLTVFALMFPLGFLMGIPFPAGVRVMNQRFYSSDVSWMWGINGLYSLLGSTLAVVIAMTLGFSMALLMGGLVYFMIFLVGRVFFGK